MSYNLSLSYTAIVHSCKEDGISLPLYREKKVKRDFQVKKASEVDLEK